MLSQHANIYAQQLDIGTQLENPRRFIGTIQIRVVECSIQA